jgi:hypothetical protein
MIAKTTIPDTWLFGYCKFTSQAARLSPPGSISRQFAKEARIRYRVFKRSGCPLMRYSCWSAIQISLRELEKEEAALDRRRSK